MMERGTCGGSKITCGCGVIRGQRVEKLGAKCGIVRLVCISANKLTCNMIVYIKIYVLIHY